MVDQVVSVVDTALARKGMSTKSLERWKEEMPREEEMRPKDKYTFFDRKAKGYRKGVHSEFFLSCCPPPFQGRLEMLGLGARGGVKANGMWDVG